MTKKPWLNFFFTVLLQCCSFAFLLWFCWMTEAITFVISERDVAEKQNLQIFIFDCVALSLISFIPYVGFFIFQRRKASNRKYLGYLKMSTRIILTICVLILNVGFIILFCFVPAYLSASTLFFQHIIEPPHDLIFPLVAFVLLNLLPHIFFKPRP